MGDRGEAMKERAALGDSGSLAAWFRYQEARRRFGTGRLSSVGGATVAATSPTRRRGPNPAPTAEHVSVALRRSEGRCKNRPA